MRDKINVGDNISGLKIYEIINECFEKDYKGWLQAWYDINDDYAAWFPTITLTDLKPNGKYGGTKTFSNTLSADKSTIIEINHDSLSKDLIDDKSSKFNKRRLIFAKINKQLVFIGIFERERDLNAEYETYIHHKIANGIDLKTMTLL